MERKTFDSTQRVGMACDGAKDTFSSGLDSGMFFYLLRRGQTQRRNAGVAEAKRVRKPRAWRKGGDVVCENTIPQR